MGIIRVRTRNSEDRPIWIPRRSRLALLIWRHYHLQARHMRRRFTKALVNEKYYIQGVNRLVERVLQTCVECQKVRHRKSIPRGKGKLDSFKSLRQIKLARKRFVRF